MTSDSKYDTQARGNPSLGLAVVSIGTLQCAQLLWKRPDPSLTNEFALREPVIVQDLGETSLNLLKDPTSML